MTFSGTVLLLSCSVESSRRNVGFFAQLLQEQLSLQCFASGRDQEVDWMAFGSHTSSGSPANLDSIINVADIVVVLNHKEATYSPTLLNLFRQAQHRKTAQNVSLVVVYLE